MVQTSKTDHFFKWRNVLRFLMASRAFEFSQKITEWLLGFNGCNLWPISVGTNTTNGRSQRSNSHFDRPSLVSSVCRRKCVHEKNRAVRVVDRVFPWHTSLTPTDSSETRGFCMNGCDLASDRLGDFVKRPKKNTCTQQIYAQTSWQISMTGSF